MDSACDLGYFGTSGDAGAFVDQAAQDRVPDDPCAAEAGNGGATAIGFTVGMRWAMPWRGRVGYGL
jgi:hypothetical protein